MHKENPEAKHTADNAGGHPHRCASCPSGKLAMAEGTSYFIIQDMLTGGYWDELAKRFRGVGYAYRMDVSSELALNEEFQEARKTAKFGVRLVLVYA